MNIAIYEAWAADVERLKSATTHVLYEMSRRRSPHGGSTMGPPAGGWPEEQREMAERVVLAIWRDLVDDYTTEGCDCAYCEHYRDGGKGGHGVQLMCSQRWCALTPEARQEIGESVAD